MRQFAAHRVAHRGRAQEILASGWGVRGGRARLVRVAVGHALDFFAWRSLRRQGLKNADAVGMMVRAVRCAVRNS